LLGSWQILSSHLLDLLKREDLGSFQRRLVWEFESVRQNTYRNQYREY
jgi:hypothetical protein